VKIVDVVCAKGRTGFYFDDQRAIKAGAEHDGFTYLGQPITPGFKAVRQAGEAVSVMIILEDGQIAYGDCAAVQYSGAGGRDPLFLAEDFIPVIEKMINPAWLAVSLFPLNNWLRKLIIYMTKTANAFILLSAMALPKLFWMLSPKPRNSSCVR